MGCVTVFCGKKWETKWVLLKSGDHDLPAFSSTAADTCMIWS